MNDNIKGALLMMGSMAAFTINDTFVKMAGQELPLFQILVIRGTAAVVMLGVMAHMMGALRFDLSRRDWLFVIIRSASEAAAAYFFLTALINMPLANATAILQVLPLSVTLGAAIFLREPFGWRRGLAILMGFAGMLLIVRPEASGFNVYSVYALIAVLVVTIRDLAVRRMSPHVPSLTVAWFGAVFVLGFALIGQFGTVWAPMSIANGAQLVGASVFILAGYYLSVHVMRVGDVAFVAPFRYTSLIWALILGVLVFGEWPDGLTLLGASIVAASGIFTLTRSRKRAARKT